RRESPHAGPSRKGRTRHLNPKVILRREALLPRWRRANLEIAIVSLFSRLLGAAPRRRVGAQMLPGQPPPPPWPFELLSCPRTEARNNPWLWSSQARSAGIRIFRHRYHGA